MLYKTKPYSFFTFRAFSPGQILKVREDPRLREQEWGNFLHPDIRRTEMEERVKVGDFYYRFTNGESGADVYDRCSLFLDTLFRENMNGAGHRSPKVDNILIVSHGLFMKLFLMRYNRWTVEKYHELRDFKNCEYCVLEHNRETGSYHLKTSLAKKKE
jgi:broad specificity phosphatase PhoE